MNAPRTARPAIPITALAVCALLVPLAARAAPATVLNRTIVATIPARDVPAFKAAVTQVLEQSADQAGTEWVSSPRTGGRGPVRVTLTPQQTTKTASTGTCRLLGAVVRGEERSERWRFWFCHGRDGRWTSSGAGASPR